MRHRTDDRRGGVGIGCADRLQRTVECVKAGEAGSRGAIAADLRGLNHVAVGVVIVFDGAHIGGGRGTRTGVGAGGGDAA